MNDKARRVLSTSAFGLCGYHTLLDLLNSSYHTQPHSLIANYLIQYLQLSVMHASFNVRFITLSSNLMPHSHQLNMFN